MALTLRMVGGLSMPEIARAFLVQEAAMGQRITRAKAKIKAARIPYRVPSTEDLPARLSGVLAVLYLVFNEGYLATGPDTDPVRQDLTAEAIRLTRLIRALMPDDGEVGRAAGVDAPHRGPSPGPGLGAAANWSPSTNRTAGYGTRAMIAEGHRLVRERLASRAPAWLRVATRSSPRSTPCIPRPATHATPIGRRSSTSTTSSSASTPHPSSRSIGRSRSPSSTARRWPWRPSSRLDDRLAGYHAYHATRADLLRRLDRNEESRAAYTRAIELAGNTAEIAYLTRRRDELG